jgi:hypothetical protein
MTSLARPRISALVKIALVALVALVYARAAGFGFVAYDDPQNVFENHEIHLPLAASLAASWSHPVFGAYLPVTRTAWSLLWHLAPAPATFHVFNLLVHLASVLLVFRLLRRLVPTTTAAAVGAAWFAIHPLQVEPVAWVTGAKDLLAALFSLLALDSFAADAVAARDSGGRARPGAHLLLAAVAYSAALLCKSSAVAVPLLAPVIASALGSSRRRAWIATAAGAALAVPVVLVTRAAERTAGAVFIPPALGARPLIALDALGFYLTRLAAPFDLVPDHGRTPGWVLAHPGGWWIAALPVAVTLVALAAASRRPRWLAAWLLFVVPLVPVLGLIPFGYQRVSTVGDRYAYLALFGSALAMAMTWEAAGNRWVRATLAFAMVAAATTSVWQLGHWRDDQTLFARVLQVNPRSWMAHVNRGAMLGEAGRFEEAAAELRAALALAPEQAEAHGDYGNALYMLGKPDSAVAEWRTALRLSPTLVMAHRNLGQVLAVRGERAEAIVHLREAVRLEPGDTVAAGSLRALGAEAVPR